MDGFGSMTNTAKDFIGILANSFTIQLTPRFSFNAGLFYGIIAFQIYLRLK
jgi:hypothetical protein